MSTLLPLKAVNDIERLKSWEGINTPSDLIKFLIKHAVVDPSAITQLFDVVYSETEPANEEDRGKLWIKTSSPIGIGIPKTDGFTMLHQFPVDVPFLWLAKRGNVPYYLEKLTSSQLEKFGLTEPDQEGTYWVIYESE